MASASTGAVESQDIIVIGAGIIGCSVAWHLLQAGVKQVAVVEANRPGSGSSGAGAGFVSHWSAGMAPMGREGFVLQQYGLDFYQALQARRDIGCRRAGTLMMSLTEAGFDRDVAPVLDSEFAPSSMRRLDASQIAAVMQGVVDGSEVYGAALNPEGIQIETGPTVAALVDELRALGGTIIEGEAVLDIDDGGADGVRLRTPNRSLQAGQVIVACGAWTNAVLAGIGARIPQLRILASRIVTGDLGIPAEVPTVQCREIPIWLREAGGGLTWGTTDGYRPMHRIEAEGYATPLGRPERPELIDNLVRRQHQDLERIFPPLKGAPIESWLQGYPCYTPDRDLIIGRLPGHPRLIVASGDNETGVTHGPGIGRLVSEMALGSPTIVDPRRYRLDRFGEAQACDEAAIEAGLNVQAVTASAEVA